MFRTVLLAMGVVVLLAAAREPGAAQSPALPKTNVASEATLVQIASGVGAVTSIANAGDSRLFVSLRDGRVVVWDGRGVLPRAFLDISRLVSNSGARGLFSVAFHPGYQANGLFFLAYSDASGNLAIARYRRSAKNANRADSKSGVVLLTVPIPANADHGGGELQFGPDGYLYVGVGDGGSGEGPPCNAQRDDVLLGKILRLDVNRHAARPPYYGIPKSNPFARAGRPLNMVWAKGLRDPRRFSFDRLTGDLYIGDVGQTGREEIDFQARASRGGENYGWGVMEGSLCAGGCQGVPIVASSETVWLPFMVVGELRAGFALGRRNVENERVLRRFLMKEGVEVLFADDQTTLHYASVFRQLRLQGTPIPTNDIWISALVLQHNLALHDRDRHFDHLPQIVRV